MQTRLQNRLTRIEIAAVLVFFAVWTYHFFTVKQGFCAADESLFVTFAERFVHGARPVVDEWNLGQFHSIFLCLPYVIYVAVKGSTAGIMLYMRYLFLAFNAVFYWIMYLRLRAYRWQSLIATLLFSLHIPIIFFACNHYTVPFRLLMIVCLILFAEKQTPLSLLLAGVLLSCAVIYQAGLAILFFGYTLLVWTRFFRQKKNKRFLDDFAFCLNMRAWVYITLSTVVCAAVFFTWVLLRGGLQDILRTLPYALTNPDFDLSSDGNIKSVFFEKAGEALDIYGFVCLIPATAILVAAIAYACGKFGEKRMTVRRILFCLACAVWILRCVQSSRIFKLSNPDVFFAMYPAPTLWIGLVCYLLCHQKNKRFLLFWIVGLGSSVCIDVISNSTLSIGSAISYIADLIFFTDLVRELHAECAEKKNTKPLRSLRLIQKTDFAVRWCLRLIGVCFAGWIIFIMLFETTGFPEHLIYGTPLFSLPYVMERGPCDGLHCSETIGQDYANHLADIDTIKSRNPKNLYICGMAPELYMYADLPYAASSCYGWKTRSFLEQQVLFWKLHPDRAPEYIYIPIDHTYNNHDDIQAQSHWIHQYIDPLCDCTREQGQGGIILHVSRWHPDDVNASK